MIKIKPQNINPNTMFLNQRGNLVPVVIIHNKLHNGVCKLHTEHTGQNKPTSE